MTALPEPTGSPHGEYDIPLLSLLPEKSNRQGPSHPDNTFLFSRTVQEGHRETADGETPVVSLCLFEVMVAKPLSNSMEQIFSCLELSRSLWLTWGELLPHTI